METYELSTSRRFVNRAFGLLVRLGVGPANAYLLTTIGRKTGQPRTTPVALVERDDERWLVSPYGTRPWVLNARAAGRVELRRGRRRTEWNIEEVDATTAAALLRHYLAENKITAPYFDATIEDGDAAFEAEAARHPVFRLSPAVG